MKQRVPVSEIMAKNIIAVPSTKKISEVNELFNEYGIRHIPVLEGTELIGVISKNDVLKIGYGLGETNKEALDAIYDSYTISDIMTKNLVVVSSDTHIKDVAEILAEQSFHSLPIVDHGEIVGLVTTTDLIKYLIKQY